MTAKSTRILKEARPLAWPWLAVALAGALPLVHVHYYSGVISLAGISFVGFVLGIPLLATLAFGNEFQSRTFSLILSQPISRHEIWREKLIVTVFAVVTAALVFSLTLGVQINHQYPHFFIFIAAWTLATIASAAFWTLWTRSTMGGVALNLAVLGLIITWVDVATHLIDSPYSVEENSAAISRIALLLVSYAALMLWLGWRKLARFQVTGTMAGDDLVTAGPDLMPSAVAEWFRSRSSGAVLNLVRKEFRLLRPVWLLTILIAVGWSSVTVYQVLHQREHVKFMPFTAGAVGVAGTILLAVLAGCMSLGEERASGRHAWHLTLPVAARTQWLVKFLMALFAGTICAGVLPLLLLAAGQSLLGMSILPDHPHYPIEWFWGVLILTAAAFWCACAANGTVTAVLWTLPVLVAIGSAPELGYWLAAKGIHMLSSKTNVFGNFHIIVTMYRAVSFYRSEPATSLPQAALQAIANLLGSIAFGESFLLVWIATALLAAIQSYRMFKRHAVAGGRIVIRRLAPLFAFTLACSFVLSAVALYAWAAAMQVYQPIYNTNTAIERLLGERGSPNSGEAMQLAASDLHIVRFPGEETPRWLDHARITVISQGPTGKNFVIWPEKKSVPATYYHATVNLDDGTELSMATSQPVHGDYPHLNVRVRWPGAAQDEPLWQSGW